MRNLNLIVKFLHILIMYLRDEEWNMLLLVKHCRGFNNISMKFNLEYTSFCLLNQTFLVNNFNERDMKSVN